MPKRSFIPYGIRFESDERKNKIFQAKIFTGIVIHIGSK